jgi:hypothetical protein
MWVLAGHRQRDFLEASGSLQLLLVSKEAVVFDSISPAIIAV